MHFFHFFSLFSTFRGPSPSAFPAFPGLQTGPPKTRKLGSGTPKTGVFGGSGEGPRNWGVNPENGHFLGVRTPFLGGSDPEIGGSDLEIGGSDPKIDTFSGFQGFYPGPPG
jgi:hypothetical protein